MPDPLVFPGALLFSGLVYCFFTAFNLAVCGYIAVWTTPKQLLNGAGAGISHLDSFKTDRPALKRAAGLYCPLHTYRDIFMYIYLHCS